MEDRMVPAQLAAATAPPAAAMKVEMATVADRGP
jgi:hypothetical protein